MVKIALDPHMYHSELSVADELRKAADLGYSYLELSSRADWFYWQRYPKADDTIIAEERGSGEMNWPEFFGALRDLRFAGTATVCVFGGEDHADDINRRMLERVVQELT